MGSVTTADGIVLNEEQVALMRGLFAEIDLDGNGTIDKEELREAIRRFSKGKREVPDSEVDWFVTSLDKSGRGAITFSEFLEGFAPLILSGQDGENGYDDEERQFKELFEVFDPQSLGKISVVDFESILDSFTSGRAAPQVEALLQENGLSHNSQLTYREFVKLMKSFIASYTPKSMRDQLSSYHETAETLPATRNRSDSIDDYRQRFSEVFVYSPRTKETPKWLRQFKKKQKAEELQIELDAVQNEKKFLNASASVLRDELHHSREEIHNLLESLSQSKQEMNELKKKLKQAEKVKENNRELQESMEKMKEQVVELKESRQAARKANTKLKEENEELQKQLNEVKETLQAERGPRKLVEKEIVYVEKESAARIEKSPVMSSEKKQDKKIEGLEERISELERENEMLKRSLDEGLQGKESVIMGLRAANEQLKHRQLEDSNLLEAAQLTIKVLRQSLEEQTLLAERARSQAQGAIAKDRISVMSELEKEVERRMRPGDEPGVGFEKRRSGSLTREKDRRKTPRREDNEFQELVSQLNSVREENDQLRRQLESFKKPQKDPRKGGDASSVVIDIIDDEDESTRKPLINQADLRSKRKKKRSNMDYDDDEDQQDHIPSDKSCWCCCIT